MSVMTSQFIPATKVLTPQVRSGQERSCRLVELFCVSLSVFAALAVRHWIEHRTGWSIKKFEHTARPYRTVASQPDAKYLPLPNPYPTTSHKHCPRSTRPPVRTSLIRVGAAGSGVGCGRMGSSPAQRWLAEPALEGSAEGGVRGVADG